MKHYFITGATGNIGSAIVPMLFETQNRIQLLIRARDKEHLNQRFHELCSYWGILHDKARTLIEPCQGDMTLPNFGLSEEIYNTLTTQCTHIIHCGGVVRMNLSIEEARKSALGTTKEIVKLAERAKRNGQFKKIDFVSTVGVIGKSRKTLTEELVTVPRDFHNTYEQAKAEAEEYLFNHYMKNQHLPITIHRPSMVVGDSKTGKTISFQVFYHLCEFLSGKRTFGLLPRLDKAKLDIIPVDYVASIIVWSTHESEMAGKFIHECSGTKQALEITDLETILKKHPVFTRNKIHVPLKWFNTLIYALATVSSERSARMLRTLPYFLNYLDDPQEFSDQRTIKLLPKEMTKNKPAPNSYIEPILNFYVKNK